MTSPGCGGHDRGHRVDQALRGDDHAADVVVAVLAVVA